MAHVVVDDTNRSAKTLQRSSLLTGRKWRCHFNIDNTTAGLLLFPNVIAKSRRKVFERNEENRLFVFVLLSAAVKGKDKGGYGACEETKDCCTC